VDDFDRGPDVVQTRPAFQAVAVMGIVDRPEDGTTPVSWLKGLASCQTSKPDLSVVQHAAGDSRSQVVSYAPTLVKFRTRT